MKRMVMMVVLVSMIGCIKPQEKQEARVREALPPKTTAESMLESADRMEATADDLESSANRTTDPVAAEDMRRAARKNREDATRLRREAENGRPAE